MDGPSGSGKSSTSKAIALRAGWNYLDTGALYRAVTWLAQEKKIGTVAEILEALKSNPISFLSDPKNPRVFSGNIEITNEIRTEKIASQVSVISAYPEIRNYLFEIQRRYIDEAPHGIVVEGRDIGTKIAPDAPLKVYLTADIQARAARRDAELADSAGHEQVAQSLQQRDLIDSTRTTSPLAMAEDAIHIDSTELTLDETVERIWELLREKSPGSRQSLQILVGRTWVSQR
jgi:GTP-binding protein